MTYNPLFDSSQLPALGPVPEDLRFDMKMLLPKDAESAGTLACDVAAFANTAGGVLLFGAHEHPTGYLNAYVPMSFDGTQRLAATLKTALDLCSPTPVADAKVLEREVGQYVVAINCDPYAAPPIGVAQAGQSGGPKWWAFPARRGRDTRNLHPEELATIMDPRLRRTLLLLDRLPRIDPHKLRRFCLHAKGMSNTSMTFDITSIDTEAMLMHIRSMPGQFSHRELLIPLDAIGYIWKDTGRGMSHIAVDGHLLITLDGLEFSIG